MRKRLKRFNLLLLTITLGVLSVFQRDIVRVIRDNSLQNLTENIIFAFFIAVFLLIFIRSRIWEKRDPAVIYIFALGILSYFYFTGPLLLQKLLLVAFFISGIILFRFFIRSGPFIPLLFILFLVFFTDIIDNIVTGNDIFILDILRNFITGIAGFISGSLFFGRR